jgi:AcrR family transcriptional regulator
MASMSGTRARLVQAGVRLLEAEGLEALSARKVAAHVGTSTMAVYTHFDGMTGLLEAIANEVFERFAQALTAVPETEDPVADFCAMGLAYHQFALEHPQRYHFMFSTSAPAPLTGYRTDLTVTGRPTSRVEWAASFDALRNMVRRMIDAGRIRGDDEFAIAGRFWSISHGAAMLEMAGFFGHEHHGLTQILGPLFIDLLVGMGDDRDQATQSMLTVATTMSLFRQ